MGKSVKWAAAAAAVVVAAGAAWFFLVNTPTDERNWQRTLSRSQLDEARSIVALSDGGFLVAGDTITSGRGGDIWVVRFDPGGKTVWEKVLGQENHEKAAAMAGLAGGGWILAGTTRSKGAGGYDGWLVRLDPDGKTLWDRTYGGKDEDAFVAVAVRTGGGIIAAGSTKLASDQGLDALVLLVDGNGREIWRKTFGGTDTDVATSIAALPDGGVAVAGVSQPKGGDQVSWVIRLDKNGEKQWERSYRGAKKNVVRVITVLPDGGYGLAGWTSSKGAGDHDVWVLRLNGAGDVIWDKTFGGPARDVARSMTVLPDGSFLVAGRTESKGAGDSDAWLLRLDPKGNLVWEKTFGGHEFDTASSVVALAGGGFAFAGNADRRDDRKLFTDFFVVRSVFEPASRPKK